MSSLMVTSASQLDDPHPGTPLTADLEPSIHSKKKAIELCLGVELELLLVPRNTDDTPDFADLIVSTYSDTSGPQFPSIAKDLEGDSDGREAFQMWIITKDVTIVPTKPEQRKATPFSLKNVLGMLAPCSPLVASELVSPIHCVGGSTLRQESLRHLWDVLDACAIIETTQSCGTHVHISTLETWELSTLKNFARPIVYFEGAINVLLPKKRKQNMWAASNRVDNTNLKDRSLTEIFTLIDAQTTVAEIIVLMNPTCDR